MSQSYGLDHRGHRIEVETEDSGLMDSSVRLLVDGRLVDEQETSSEASLQAELTNGESARTVGVEVSFNFLGEVKRCVLIDGAAEYPMQETQNQEEDEGGVLEDLLDFLP